MRLSGGAVAAILPDLLIEVEMKNEHAQEALDRAQSGHSLVNYPAIIQGFIDKGIAADDIKPRENVFTFHAWRALGRQVRKGEHGIKVLTFVPMSRVEHDASGKDEVKSWRSPRSTTVFHVSQTDPIGENNAAPVVRAPPAGNYSTEFTQV